MGRKVSRSETVFFAFIARNLDVTTKRFVVGSPVKVVSALGNSVLVKGCVDAVNTIVELGILVVLKCVASRVAELTKAVTDSQVLRVDDGKAVVRVTPVGLVKVVSGARWVLDIGSVIGSVVRQREVVAADEFVAVNGSDGSGVHRNGFVNGNGVVGTTAVKKVGRRVEARNWPCSVSGT